MSTVTPKLNLVKAATVEQYSLATTNNNLDKIDAEAVSNEALIKTAMKIIGVHGASATFGTIPVVATSSFKVNFGSTPLTTDASGYVAVDMPTAFSNGYIVVAMMNGDVQAQANANFALSTGIFTNTASRFYVRVITANTGAALVSGTLRLNYIVIGH